MNYVLPYICEDGQFSHVQYFSICTHLTSQIYTLYYLQNEEFLIQYHTCGQLMKYPCVTGNFYMI